MQYTKYQSSRPSGFREDDFQVYFFYMPYVKRDPRGGANIDPRGIV